jgi:hypothetical protein
VTNRSQLLNLITHAVCVNARVRPSPGCNRVENVHQIPPGEPDFETLDRRRHDAESINRHVEDTLWL